MTRERGTLGFSTDAARLRNLQVGLLGLEIVFDGLIELLKNEDSKMGRDDRMSTKPIYF